MLYKLNTNSLIFIIGIIGLLLVFLFTLERIEQQQSVQSIKKEEIQAIRLSHLALKGELEQGISDILYLSQLSDLINIFQNKQVIKETAADFKLFLSSRSHYSQLSLIDIHGDVKLRMVKSDSDVFELPLNELKNEAEEEYFKEASTLLHNQPYISDFQLNKLNGRIQRPFNPILRFVSPVYDDKDEHLVGLAVLRYVGKNLIDAQKDIEGKEGRKLLLTNSEGYFLKGDAPEDEWGFMFDDKMNATMKSILPEVWELYAQAGSQRIIGDKLYTYSLICDSYSNCPQENLAPNDNILKLNFKGSDFPWLIISVADKEKSAFIENQEGRQWSFYIPLLILSILVGIALYAMRRANKTTELHQIAEAQASQAQNYLHSFLEYNPALVFCKDLRGKYQFANKAYLNVLRQDIEALLGKTDFELFDSPVVTNGAFSEQKVLHSQQPVTSIEIWNGHHDESYKYAVTRFPISNKSDDLVAVGTIALDITEQEKAKSKMEETMALFKAVVESAPDAILLVGNDGVMTFANKQASELFGWSEDELLTMTVEELMPDKHRHSHVRLRQSYADNPTDLAAMSGRVFPALRKGGSEFNIEISISPITFDGHKGIVCICRDVTQREKVENHLKHTQKLEAIGQLTGGIAHDFNNLLGIIIGNLDLLKISFSTSDEKVKKRIDSAIKAAMNGAELTKRLLSFARKQDLHPEIIAMDQAIDNLLSLLDRTLKADISLNVLIQPSLPCVLLDISEFENVVVNMAINSRDAMPNGGVLSIEVKSILLNDNFTFLNLEPAASGEYVQITISDTGTGIPKAILDKVFEPFFTTKEIGKGTGLGLSMVHGFVKQMKGYIRVYSEEGVGTTFHIYLPAVIDSELKSSIKKSEVNNQLLPHGNERILVVDDEVDLAEIASAYLKQLGYDVEVACSAEDAIEILKDHHDFSLVFTDIVMPGGMTGIELHDYVVNQYPNIRFLYASGFSEVALKAKNGHGLKAELLTKPYNQTNLAVAIRHALDN